jgi:hypothetical protein
MLQILSATLGLTQEISVGFPAALHQQENSRCPLDETIRPHRRLGADFS